MILKIFINLSKVKLKLCKISFLIVTNKLLYNNQNVTGIVVLLHKIDAPKKIIQKAELEIDNHPSCKPTSCYLENIRKTNR